jgi:exopolyphosphatase/guanosine-5'-triphosphate,3'-diphosphate pyrophosphatase
MDIGTNSVRLLIVRVEPNHAYRILTDQKEVVRLGEDEFVEQRLQPKAMQRAALICARFAHLAHSHGAHEIIAVATAAVREAENKSAFLRRLRQEAELEVRVVSGMEEARLIYLGVSSGVHLGEKTALFVDIGGGSTEIAVGNQQQHHFLASLSLGAIRVSSLFLTDPAAPVSPEHYALIQRNVRVAAVRAIQQVRRYHLDLAIGSSGTIQNLADIAARMFNRRKRERDGGVVPNALTHDQLKQVVKVLCDLPLDKRRQVPGINPERADIIIGGAAVLDTLMQELQVSELAISERGLRDGLLMDYLSRRQPDYWQMSVRQRSVLQLGRTCGFDEAHAQNVAALALELFDSAREAGLHDLGAAEREWLHYAALLHDVGAFLAYNSHHAHTHYIISNAELLGFDQTEVAIIAATALFHRKAFAGPKRPEFAALDRRSQKIVRTLSVLLRMAENLNRGHTNVVRHATLRVVSSKKITLAVHAAGDCQLELWGVQSNQAAFEKELGRAITIELVADKSR